jgi:5-(carboxyamino)imidazole ribonucleotide mutase
VKKALRNATNKALQKSSSKSRGKSFGKKSAPKSTRVAIIMGSDSDYPVMKDAVEALKEFGVKHEVKIVSAHRTPVEMAEFAESASSRGIRVIIAGAGGAAHLPGMVAAHSELPVIGVPVPMGHLQGQDALLSIVQMPKGVPVATVAIGNAYNAGLLAVQILAAGGEVQNSGLLKKMVAYKSGLRKKVLAKKL